MTAANRIEPSLVQEHQPDPLPQQGRYAWRQRFFPDILWSEDNQAESLGDTESCFYNKCIYSYPHKIVVRDRNEKKSAPLPTHFVQQLDSLEQMFSDDPLGSLRDQHQEVSLFDLQLKLESILNSLPERSPEALRRYQYLQAKIAWYLLAYHPSDQGCECRPIEHTSMYWCQPFIPNLMSALTIDEDFDYGEQQFRNPEDREHSESGTPLSLKWDKGTRRPPEIPKTQALSPTTSPFVCEKGEKEMDRMAKALQDLRKISTLVHDELKRDQKLIEETSSKMAQSVVNTQTQAQKLANMTTASRATPPSLTFAHPFLQLSFSIWWVVRTWLRYVLLYGGMALYVVVSLLVIFYVPK